MKKLKIGLFMDDYYPSMNGVIEVMDNYAKRLVSLGHEVVVVVPEIDKNYVDDFSYKVIRLPSIRISPIGYNAAFVQLNKLLERKLLKEKFDIVHIHSPFIVGSLGVKIAKKLRVPVVGTMHTQFDKDITKIVKLKYLSGKVLRYIANIYNKCDKNFAVNKKTADVYMSYNVKKHPEILITGTDMHLINDENLARKEINSIYKLEDNELIFLFVGRLTLVKNIPFLLRALSILKTENLEYKMLFVGPFEDEKEIRKLVSSLDLESNVKFLGKITDRNLLQKIYRRADLFLFPSLYDTNSLVQKEAASQKTPTVFIKKAVTAELVTDNLNGFLSENDEVAYANKIKEVVNNRKLYQKVSEGAYKDLFISWDDLILDLEKKYYSVLNSKKYRNRKTKKSFLWQKKLK